MTVAEQLTYYQQTYHLTKEAVAQALQISRQSVSKWENGESYPSIENLISLRGLYHLSIDELITGKNFLSLPFIVGKEQSARYQLLKRPLLFSAPLGFLIGLFSSSVAWGISTFIIILFICVFFFYTLSVDLLYQNWVLERSQLLCLPAVTSPFSLWRRTMAILTKKEDHLLQPLDYKAIKRIQLVYEKKAFDIYTSNLTRYNLTPVYFLATRDPFYFLVTTHTGRTIKLDLTINFFHCQTAYDYLGEILNFFESKNLPVDDPLDIVPIQQGHYRLYDYLYYSEKHPTSPK
ncbi:helix-turn-helix transcriptional regulator [uncultured Vagococcus sp.]|uniref:helix-turn-helix domain-containing protein n=1 Tax=uncultured Vagococcus sp. TaxID=189676 RepID=UPI0028D788F9|nr:helix-turn-helix transcriptional regulator [uncultured Vagococcus sp.]